MGRDSIRPHTRKLVCGIGDSGVVYKSKSYVYLRWKTILLRVTDPKNHNYTDCSVCDEWLILDNFAKWFEENYIDGYEIDKDLLVYGNREYAPDKCIFIPCKINSSFRVKCKKSDLPFGISLHRNKYRASNSNKTFSCIAGAVNNFWNIKYKMTSELCCEYPEFKELITNHFEHFFSELYYV